MRKDIEVSAFTDDVALDNKRAYTTYPFRWLETPTGEQPSYVYGEITMPAHVSEAEIRESGLYAAIPYLPVYKPVMVRVKRMVGVSTYTVIRNSVGGMWFAAKVGLYGGAEAAAYASQIMLVSEEAVHVSISGMDAVLHDARSVDFNIVKANRQNGNMLLKCVPTNNYRYPLTGVGLIRWTNSNIEYTKLSEVLQREFQDDGVTVINASYDFDKKDLYLDLDTTFVDLE